MLSYSCIVACCVAVLLAAARAVLFALLEPEIVPELAHDVGLRSGAFMESTQNNTLNHACAIIKTDTAVCSQGALCQGARLLEIAHDIHPGAGAGAGAVVRALSHDFEGCESRAL